MIDFWLSQSFGILAILFDAIKFTRKSRHALLLWGIPAGWSMVVSQYFLGQNQGAAFQAMSSLETLLQAGLWKKTALHGRFRIGIAVLFGAFGFWIYAPTAEWFTWLPVGSYLFATLGKVFHRPHVIRVVWLASSACTMTYAAVYGNWSILVQQVMVISLTLWMVFKAHTAE